MNSKYTSFNCVKDLALAVLVFFVENLSVEIELDIAFLGGHVFKALEELNQLS